MKKENYQMWLNNMVRNEEAQKLLEEKVEILVNSFFDDNEYAVEKFIKSFGEPIRYLEDVLETNRGISPDQINRNRVYISLHPDEYIKKVDEVQRILLSEIERQSRHFRTFLSAVKR